MASLAWRPGGDGLICTVCAFLYGAHTSVQCVLSCTEHTLMYSVRFLVKSAHFCIVCAFVPSAHFCIVCDLLYTAHTFIQCALFCTVCSPWSHASLALEDSGSRGRERDSNSTENLYFIQLFSALFFFYALYLL